MFGSVSSHGGASGRRKCLAIRPRAFGLLGEQDPVVAVLGVPGLCLRELGRPIRARPGERVRVLRVAGPLPGDRVHLLAAALLDAAEHPPAVVHELRYAHVLEVLPAASGQRQRHVLLMHELLERRLEAPGLADRLILRLERRLLLVDHAGSAETRGVPLFTMTPSDVPSDASEEEATSSSLSKAALRVFAVESVSV